MARGDDITPRKVEEALRDQVDSLVPKLLPRAVLDGGYWNVGSTRGEPGTQMKINSTVGERGLWTDWSEAKGSDHYSGDCLKLIAAVLFGGWSTPEGKKNAIQWAVSWLGWDDLDPARLRQVQRESAIAAEQRAKAADEEREGKRTSAYWMWKGAVAIKDTAAEAYLDWREIGPAVLGRFPGALRFVPDAWCSHRRGKYPALLAQIIGLDGQLVGVHRTYLDVSAGRNGPVRNFKLPPDAKGRRKSHKASLGPYSGGHIPVWKGAHRCTLREIPAGTPVYVSEGIEDGLTIALAKPEARIVAGVALANMGGFALPPQAGPLIFIGQRDPIDGKAIEAFERAIARQQDAAKRDGSDRKVQLIMPEPGFKDFNDQLRGLRMAEAA